MRGWGRRGRSLGLGVAAAALAILAGCPDFGDPVDPDGGPGDGGPGAISLARDVQPILSDRCALPGCHAGTVPQADMSLEAGGTFGMTVGVPAVTFLAVRVVEGKPDSSLLYLKLLPGSLFPPQMPLNQGTLPASERDLIRDWIAQGALDN